MVYEVMKMDYKELLILISNWEEVDFSIKDFGRYIKNSDYVCIFQYNKNGKQAIGLQLGDDGLSLEEFIQNVEGIVKYSDDYGCVGEFKPVALIVKGYIKEAHINTSISVVLS